VGESRADSRRLRREALERARRRRNLRALVLASVAIAVAVVTGALLLASASNPSTAASSTASVGSPPLTAAADTATASAGSQSATEIVPVSAQADDPQVATETAAYTARQIGASVRGLPIEAIVFGKGQQRLLVVGGVHGDEFGDDVAAELVERLKSHPELVPAQVEIHVIPCLNPDGREMNSRGNSRGVDINRNMPAGTWSAALDPGDSSATRGLSSGSSPGSEPESQTFISYMSNGFSSVISLHSRGGIVDWDGPGEDLARAIADKTGMPAQHLGYQSSITGSMGQYVPEKWAIPIITIELNSPSLTDGLFDSIIYAATWTRS